MFLGSSLKNPKILARLGTTSTLRGVTLFPAVVYLSRIMVSLEKPLYVTDPEAWLQKENEAHAFLCVVIFRGSWCKFDKHYLTALGKHNESHMKQEQVYLIAWTSEGAEGAAKADEAWNLTSQLGYNEVLGDETCALANYLKEDEILPNLVTSTPQEAHVEEFITPGTYPNGIVQPGMVFYAHHGNLSLQWEAEVHDRNSFGGANRPQPSGA
jgi:hypothetical protein